MSDVSLVIVSRLRECAAPYFGWVTRRMVMRHRARAEYLDGPARTEAMSATDLRKLIQRSGWDLGRVRHFVERVESGDVLDPIELESVSYQARPGSPLAWGPPGIMDGNHRLAAAAILGLERIPATFGGPLTTLKWLTGARRTPPPEVFE